MMYRVRTWAGQAPLPSLDVTTGSLRVAVDEVRARGERHGWDSVSLIIDGGAERLKGDKLLAFIEQYARRQRG